MENNASLLISFYVKEKIYKKSLSKEEKKIYKQLYKEGNEFSNILSKNCGILYKLESMDILKINKKQVYKVNFYSGLVCYLIGFIFLQTYGISLIIWLYLSYQIEKQARKKITGNVAIKYGFGEQDIINYGLEPYIYGADKNNDITNEKYENFIKDFFLDLILYIGTIQNAIKVKESINQILEIFEILINKKDEEWNIFKAEKI